MILESMEKRLRRGLQALGLPEDGAASMAMHARLLMERNQVMNLTALQSEEEIVNLHFLDSCALLNLFDFHGKSVLDIGSGAGFPGLPLKMADPSVRLVLLDAQKKRVDFLREVCRETGLSNVTCIHARAEEWTRNCRESFDVVISRAVAALPILAELCMPLVRVDGYFLAMKSVHTEEEVSAARNAISILGGTLERTADYAIPGTDVIHRLIVVRKVQKTPPRYPRPFGQIKKKPLEKRREETTDKMKAREGREKRQKVQEDFQED